MLLGLEIINLWKYFMIYTSVKVSNKNLIVYILLCVNILTLVKNIKQNKKEKMK